MACRHLGCRWNPRVSVCRLRPRGIRILGRTILSFLPHPRAGRYARTAQLLPGACTHRFHHQYDLRRCMADLLTTRISTNTQRKRARFDQAPQRSLCGPQQLAGDPLFAACIVIHARLGKISHRKGVCQCSIIGIFQLS